MNKFFSGLAVVALLLTPLAIASPARAVTVKVQREYGQGPVTIPAGVDRVEIVFHGRRGTRPGRRAVRQGVAAGPVGTGGSVDRRYLEDFPAPGRYSFVLTRCRAHEEASARRRRSVSGRCPSTATPRCLRYRGTSGSWARRGSPSARSRAGTAHRGAYGVALVRPVPPGRALAGHRELAPGARTFAAGRVPRGRRARGQRLGTMATSVEPLVPRAGQRVILLPSNSRVRARATQDPPGARHDRRRGRRSGGRAAVPGGRRAVHLRGRPVGDGDGERGACKALVHPAGAHVTRRVDAGRVEHRHGRLSGPLVPAGVPGGTG